MAQILVFTQRLELELLVDVEFKSLTGVDPEFCNDINEFNLNLSNNDYEVVIFDQPIKPNDLNQTYKILSSKSFKHMVVISHAAPPIKSTYFKLNEIENFIQFLRKEFNLFGDDGFISIPIKSLIHFKKVPVDLYLKLSEGKYIKRLPANEEISEEVIGSLKMKGVGDVFFQRKFNRNFSSMLVKSMVNRISSDYPSIDKKIKASDEVFSTTTEIIQGLGFPKKIIEVCEKVVDSIYRDLCRDEEQNKIFVEYLNELKTNREISPHYRFKLLSGLIGTQILKQHPDKNEEDIKTFIFCNLFSDIGLVHQEYMFIRSKEDLKKYPVEDYSEITDHAQKSADIISGYVNAPAHAYDIVKHHHGSLHGMGFPEIIAENLHPISSCLFISQEIANIIISNPREDLSFAINKVTDQFFNSYLIKDIRIFETTSKMMSKKSA